MKFTQQINSVYKMMKKLTTDYKIDQDQLNTRLRRMELDIHRMTEDLYAVEKENQRLTRILLQAGKIPEEPKL